MPRVGEGATLPTVGTPPTRLFNSDHQVVDAELKGSMLPFEDHITIIKDSSDTVIDGLVSY